METQIVSQLRAGLVPVEYQPFVASLPIAEMVFGKDKTHVVNSRLLHRVLGISRRHPTWIADQVKKHGLIEGVDYFVQSIAPDDQASFNLTVNETKNFDKNTLLTCETCALISTHTNNDIGRRLFKYMYWVVDKHHNAEMALIKAQVEKLNGDLEFNNREMMEQEKALQAYAEDTKTGHVVYYNNRQNMRKLEDENKRLRSTDTYKNDLVLQQASKNFYRLAETLRDKKIGTKDMLEEVVECAKRIDERDFTFVACF